MRKKECAILIFFFFFFFFLLGDILTWERFKTNQTRTTVMRIASVKTTTTMADFTESMTTFGEVSRHRANVSDVFKTFHETYDASDMEILCTAYKNLSYYHEIALKALSIKSANCIESVSFANASVVVEEHLDTWYPIGMVFLTGLRVLQAFLQEETVPEPGKKREILSSLLTYLLDKGTV